MAWHDVCKLKSEGGLELRPLKEVNVVNGLKLIWRILSAKSLWSQWVHKTLLNKNNFWEVNDKSQMGSWMWKKILKLRDKARDFYKVEIGDGKTTSFWNDPWSELGVMSKLLGYRGVIEMGIRRSATVEEALFANRRRRTHRTQLLNQVEEELSLLRRKHDPGKSDVTLWKSKAGYKSQFSSKETWYLMREDKEECSWVKGV